MVPIRSPTELTCLPVRLLLLLCCVFQTRGGWLAHTHSQRKKLVLHALKLAEKPSSLFSAVKTKDCCLLGVLGVFGVWRPRHPFQNTKPQNAAKAPSPLSLSPRPRWFEFDRSPTGVLQTDLPGLPLESAPRSRLSRDGGTGEAGAVMRRACGAGGGTQIDRWRQGVGGICFDALSTYTV